MFDTHRCKVCDLAQNAKWRSANSEKIKGTIYLTSQRLIAVHEVHVY